MSALNISCDIKQGYAFQATATTPFGYLTELYIGGQMLAADQPVNPAVVNNPGTVVAVLSSVKWAGGVANPLQFVGQVSLANAEYISNFLQQTSPFDSIRFKFLVYQYDQQPKQYFEEFYSGNAEMQGIFAQQGKVLDLQMYTTPMPYPANPPTFQFTIAIMPAPLAGQQMLQVASSATAKLAKPWGVPLP
ncbi:MAG TPA: hypothetical protein VE779_06475 [Candidatus Angelobacter sp.]|nr:hypothetical protein [Candidatus Angelobacter sp.]